MNKIFSIFLIVALNMQALSATNLFLSGYTGNSYRVIVQNYHFTYLYSKIGLDFQHDTNLNKHLPYIYLSLGIPIIESIVKIPLSNDVEIGHKRHSNTRGFAISLEQKYKKVITGIFLEMPSDPERFRFGYSIGVNFDDKINNEKSTSMNKINKYATYTFTALGVGLFVGTLMLFSGAGH